MEKTTEVIHLGDRILILSIIYGWFLKEGGNGKSKKNIPEPLLVQGVLSRHFA